MKSKSLATRARQLVKAHTKEITMSNHDDLVLREQIKENAEKRLLEILDQIDRTARMGGSNTFIKIMSCSVDPCPFAQYYMADQLIQMLTQNGFKVERILKEYRDCSYTLYDLDLAISW